MAENERNPAQELLADPHRVRGDAQLLRRAIREGWITGQRWPTEASTDDFQEAAKSRSLTMKERAALTVLKGLGSQDERTQQAAVKSVVAMEAQNQNDDLKKPPRRKLRPVYQPPPQQILIIDGNGNQDEARRQLVERIARLRAATPTG